MKKRSNNWKKIEYKVAKMVGGMRVPVSGSSRTIKGDVLHPKYFIEVKTGKQVPKWVIDTHENKKDVIKKHKYVRVLKIKMPSKILKWWNRTKKDAPDGKKPLLVVKPRYCHEEFVIFDDESDLYLRFTTLKKFVEIMDRG